MNTADLAEEVKALDATLRTIEAVLDLARMRREKADLSDEEMLLMKRLFRKVHTQLASQQQKADIAQDVVARCFTDAQRTAIKEGNSALSQYLGRDLARFGYPVREVEDSTSGKDGNAYGHAMSP